MQEWQYSFLLTVEMLWMKGVGVMDLTANPEKITCITPGLVLHYFIIKKKLPFRTASFLIFTFG